MVSLYSTIKMMHGPVNIRFTYTDDIRGSKHVTQSTHPSLTDTTFTKACAISQFSAPTEALPTPTYRNLECVLCTLQGRGCTYKRKTQTRSRNHFAVEKQ